ELFAHSLIPFHEMGDALRCVRSPEELIAAVESAGAEANALTIDSERLARRMAVVEEHLGPFDGRATERAIGEIERFTEAYRARPRGSPPMMLRLARNTAANVVGLGVSIAVTLVMTPFLIRTLGRESYGLWVLVMSFSVLLGFLSLLDLGIQSSVVRFVAEHNA